MVIAKTTSLSESKKASENSGLSELAGRDIISSIISGNEYAQSFSQNSQYRAGGISSCGLAALNCVRVAFQKEQDGQDNVLEALLSADTTNEILMVSDMWSGSSHLEVDELLQLPLFTRNLELIETQYSEESQQR
ncbi:hypothetical protein GYMLUDRAFT_832931 [Collybiopsis luxurians FD-317 M1]|uniref:Uncharacterized protein n=1 Tax=Collybiopsis luxurians FD-317 M1 TaxID=944289 RepID=A0A0D0BLI0_9AGAR|nr:hypothetical protein GYMLUDRAFT_832931 [Collybiopsis luxurians FD-317 M1]